MSEIVLDNFYLYLLVELGIVGYIIYSYIYYKSTSLMNNKNYNIILICFLIYGLFETNVIIGSIQFIFPIQMKYLIENNKKSEMENKIE